jgi:hypothetical protein
LVWNDHRDRGHPPAEHEGAAVMKRRLISLMSLAILSIYAMFCVRGWLGVEEINKRNQDGTYWAAVYSHSRLFVPFMKTRDVLIPSVGDLNSHTVFELHGIRQRVGIQWLNSNTLQITCRYCNQSSLLENKVDDINIHLIKQ